jgi:protein-disulfide isomerase
MYDYLSRLIAVLLLATGLALPTIGNAAEPLTPEQKQAVEQVIHDYFLQHPEFMVEVLRAAETKLKEEKAADARHLIAEKRSDLLNDASSPVAGNPNGDVTIVEFFDYRCPYCKQVEPILQTLVKEDPKIRIVYKEFPILGPDSTYATRVALAARKQGKYTAFHDAMMAAKGQISEDVILKVAETAGVDIAKAKADMNAPDIDAIIKRNLALAEALEIQGTPTFIIGDTVFASATDLNNLKKMVANARKSS